MPREWAARFTWDTAAAETWAVYDRVARRLMLHVGLNLVFLIPGETGGMETAARETIPHLAASDDLRLTLFVNREAAGTFGGVAEEVVVPVNAATPDPVGPRRAAAHSQAGGPPRVRDRALTRVDRAAARAPSSA